MVQAGKGQVKEPKKDSVEERVEVVLERPVHGGACLAHVKDGRTLFVRGGIPGETVEAVIASSHKRFAWADVTRVIEASVHRVPHIWPEAAEVGVGGVELGHVSPEYQREWKTQVLADQMRRIGGKEVVAQIRAAYGEEEGDFPVRVQAAPGDASTSPTQDALLGRRTRLQLVADARGRLGMRKYRSHDVVPLTSLPIADPRIQELNVVDSEVWKKHWSPGERISVEAPSASPSVVVTSTGVFSAPGQSGPQRSVWEVAGESGAHRFEVRPGGFWQTHREAPTVLAQAVVEGAQVGEGDVILELYSGSGLFSRFLADHLGETGKLLTLEGNIEAVRAAGEVLGDDIATKRVQIFQGSVDAAAVSELVGEAGGPVTTVVVDPPRRGAGKEVVQAICASSAQRVVVVSCDPAAGARDLADFLAGGFTVESMRAWDLFPHTHHFEMVTTLTR